MWGASGGVTTRRPRDYGPHGVDRMSHALGNEYDVPLFGMNRWAPAPDLPGELSFQDRPLLLEVGMLVGVVAHSRPVAYQIAPVAVVGDDRF